MSALCHLYRSIAGTQDTKQFGPKYQACKMQSRGNERQQCGQEKSEVRLNEQHFATP
jgi:hypothetical protein